MPVVADPEQLPVWSAPRTRVARQYFGAARPLHRPAAANAQLQVELLPSTRNTPAGGQLRVYGPIPGKVLCFPGTESALPDNFPVLSPSFPGRRACRQCPSGHPVREKLLSPVRTTSARLRSHPARERHPPGSSSTRRRRSDPPVLERLRGTPRTGNVRGYSHLAT